VACCDAKRAKDQCAISFAAQSQRACGVAISSGLNRRVVSKPDAAFVW